MRYKIYFYSHAFKCWSITSIEITLKDAIEKIHKLKSQGIERCYIQQEDDFHVKRQKTLIQRILQFFNQYKAYRFPIFKKEKNERPSQNC